jgi:hypothetical protein
MDFPKLADAFLGDRRASQYILSTPEDAIVHLLESLGIDLFDPKDLTADSIPLLGQGAYPLVIALYNVELETDVPHTDVLRCLEEARPQARIQRIIGAFLNRSRYRMVKHALPMMCICRESTVKRIRRGRVQCIYDFRAGERWIEMHLGQEAIPGIARMSA